MDTKKKLAKLVKDIELPVPEGHVRKRKGFYYRFVPASQIGAVVARLTWEFGTPEIWDAGPTLWWSCEDVRFGIKLPHGNDFAVMPIIRQ